MAELFESRAAILQRILDCKRDPVYLEIGVKNGDTFFALCAARKLGVDPRFKGRARRFARSPSQWLNRGGLGRALFRDRLFSTTSDLFFARHGAWLQRLGVDVAFVDGMHSYEHSLADVLHVLEVLRPDGMIVVDDCNPSSLASATYPREEAERLVAYNGRWCGDVYKTIVHLRTLRDDLDVFTLDCLFGVAVVRYKPHLSRAPRVSHEDRGAPVALDYGHFDKERGTLLNLRSPDYLLSVLGASWPPGRPDCPSGGRC